jgi:uncharacterized protein YkwD
VPTYGHPWQGHMTMYPDPVPAGQQRPQAFVVTPGLYASPVLLFGPQQQQQQAAPAPGWKPCLGASWEKQSLSNSFSTMALHPPPYLGPGLGGGLRHDAPHHSISW